MSPSTPQEALICLLIVTAAADADITDAELQRIGLLVQTLPAFRDFEDERLLEVARECQKILQRDEGLEEILEMVRTKVPHAAYDTAYALAVEVAAVDLHVEQEELRILQMLRDRLDLDKLTVAAIERAAKARFRVF